MSVTALLYLVANYRCLAAGIKDTRMPYYTYVTGMTARYCAEHEIGESFMYGHNFSVPKMPELVHFDGVHTYDGNTILLCCCRSTQNDILECGAGDVDRVW